MANAASGDTRVRRRCTTVLSNSNAGFSATGAYSGTSADLKFCDQHYIAVVRLGTVTSGIFSVRGLPIGAPVTTPTFSTPPSKASMLGIEGIDFTKINNMVWDVRGYYAAFELAIATVIGGGGTIAIVINSVDTNG